jgi:alanyl-tRNA synthetase
MDIRAAYLDFFEKKGHKVVPSANLVPDDPSLLFTNAGMVPFKSIFTGEVPAPNPPRATSSQTCIRAGGKHNDLENVGYTNRHHTFFEMLGNFSFGDYFKEEAIAYAWEFVTEVLKLPKERLWVTVHESDDEAEEIWKRHISSDRIMRFGDKDNFWQMGDTGPCGPCSEIFYDQGEEHFHSDEDRMGGEGDRFLEIWNLVFMQYERDKEGNLTPLPRPSIDTGMGLERVTAIMEGKISNFDSSLFMPLIEKISKMVQKPYIYEEGASFRVIADHIRAVTFLLAQGVNFDKEGRGYVLRRILRRAVRHGYLLGLKEPFMFELVDTLNEIMGEQYSYLKEKSEAVKEQIRLEEERFFKTIAMGLELFNDELKNTDKTFSGEVAFKLYDTYGFPLDLTADMLRERGLEVDESRFDELMKSQRERAKAAWKGSGDSAVSGDFKELIEEFKQNSFVGYEEQVSRSKVLALLDGDFKRVEALKNGDTGWVFLDKTPFYAESGGQVGDEGELEGRAKVLDTKKFFELNLSKIELLDDLMVGDSVKAKVSHKRREIARHHSATHLLHYALREVLGDHISQAGSLNDDQRLRFDFSHPKALSLEEIKRVEDMVNKMILSSISSITEVLPIDEAKKSGAVALFGEKYGDLVRVVKIGESVEFCGGTHVQNSSQIGLFFITKESGVSAGVRRIEAVCSQSALEYAKDYRSRYLEVANEVKNQDALLGVKRIKSEIKELKNEIASLQSSSKKELNFENLGNVEVSVEIVKNGDIKSIIDEVKNQKERVALLLLQPKGDKVLIAAGVKGAGIKAGEWIKKVAPIVGGGGGGRDDFAQAGGKDVGRIEEAKKIALEFAKEALS